MLGWLLRKIIASGTLTVIGPEGFSQTYGDGGEPAVAIRIHSDATIRHLVRDPAMAAGEAYMDGLLTIEAGKLQDFMFICACAIERLDALPLFAARRTLLRPLHLAQRFNSRRRSIANVAHHYDLSGQLYDLFLDADRQYSCAYFENGDETLEQAQAKKKNHNAAKLCLKPGKKVLDIGSGWGGLALTLAKLHPGIEVTGLTLSQEQLGVARDRAAAAGLQNRVRFELRDYRDEPGSYDRIVSVGMLEHVGLGGLQSYFNTVQRLLKSDGVALLHAIGIKGQPGEPNSWLRKYIFPGSYCPSLSQVLPTIEKAGLWTTDIEILRLHYAKTLDAWANRFAANRYAVEALYDSRFCRMWEFYLRGCEGGFRYGPMMVFQIQLARTRDAVPLTRDYMNAPAGQTAPERV